MQPHLESRTVQVLRGHDLTLCLSLCVVLLLSTLGCKAAAKGPAERHAGSRETPTPVAVNETRQLPPTGSRPGTGNLLLRTGFEDAVVVPPANKAQKQVDVLKLKLPSGAPAEVGIFYEGGGPSARFAKVVPDPTNPGNQVLHYWLKDARIPGQRAGKSKGRVQMALPNLAFKEVYQRYRVYLHPDLALYRAYPGANAWFTINELWFGASWNGDPHPFRITLGIAKAKGAEQPLHFLASGEAWSGGRKQGKWNEVWHSLNSGFRIPVGEWVDVELGYRQGDKNSGRFYLAAKRSSDPAIITVIDVHDWTYNPQSPKPVPMTQWNPLKLYTSGAIIDYIRNQGGVTQIYFDDLEISKSWPR